MNKEIWKPVVGYESLYEVSNQGRVKSLRFNRIMNPFNNRRYKMVDLKIDGKRKSISVHRLVAFAFIPNQLNKPCVNHVDENPSNNMVGNLEWVTYSENNNHGTRNERISEDHSISIVQLSYDGSLVKEWDSTKNASEFGYTRSGILRCLDKKLKTHKGYRWMRKEEFNDILKLSKILNLDYLKAQGVEVEG